MRSLAVLIILALAVSSTEAAHRGPLTLDGALAGPAIIVVGERGLIRRSLDGGTTWKPIESGVTRTLCAVSFSDDRNGWAAGHGAVILRTTDGGVSWEHQFTGED